MSITSGRICRWTAGCFCCRANELVKRWFRFACRDCFPEFDVTCVAERHLFRFRAAQHIVDMDYEKKNPACRTPPPGGFPGKFPANFPENRGANFAVREGIKIPSPSPSGGACGNGCRVIERMPFPPSWRAISAILIPSRTAKLAPRFSGKICGKFAGNPRAAACGKAGFFSRNPCPRCVARRGNGRDGAPPRT